MRTPAQRPLRTARFALAPLAALLTAAMLLGPAGPSGAGQAPPSQDAAALARRASERLRALRAEAQALLAQERTLLGELRRLSVERALKLEELRQIEADTARVEEDLAGTTRHLELLQRSHAEQTPALRARLQEVYKLGSGGYVRLLLAVDHPRDLGRALRAVSTLAALDRERARAHRSTMASLAAARGDLERRRSELETLRRSLVDARAALDRAVRDRTALVDAIDARRDLNAQLTGELETAHAKLQQTVAGLGDGSGASLPLHTLQGTLEWPAAGRVTTRFGRSRSGVGAVAMRRGIELATEPGAAVRAVHPGTVAYAAPFSGFGNLVVLDHGSRAVTVYGHLDELRVAKGAQLASGAVVGTAGVDPAGRPALYFELRVDGEPVDPLQWLKPGTP